MRTRRSGGPSSSCSTSRIGRSQGSRSSLASGLRGASLFAPGAVSEARLAYFDREEKRYVRIEVPEQVEVASLVGTIALRNGNPKVHAHAVLGRRDGTTVAGHVMEARAWPTLEVVVTTLAPLHRERDEETGLALVHL